MNILPLGMPIDGSSRIAVQVSRKEGNMYLTAITRYMEDSSAGFGAVARHVTSYLNVALKKHQHGE